MPAPGDVTVRQQLAGHGDHVTDTANAQSSRQAEPAVDPLATVPQGPDAYPEADAGSEPLAARAGKYIIQGEIAHGGMGAILRAVDPDFQRVLAVKVMLPSAARQLEAQRRFLQEARITGRLQHPGIPPIHELGRLDDGSPFFAMKLIEGQTLAQLLGDAPRSDAGPGLVGIFEQVCRTLAYAHSQGVIHRDLKPTNVMVGAFGEVQVMDWGLAKVLADPERSELPAGLEPASADDMISRAGDVIGTPAYMAPEQARGETDQLDERCDVFGLGGILCDILTGQPPFSGSGLSMLEMSARADLAGARQRLDTCGADAGLVEIAKRCLAPAPANRYRDAGAVADAVTGHREGVQERLRRAELARETAQVQAQEERRRRRLALTLAAALLVLVLGGAGAGLWYVQFTAQRQARARTLNELVTRSLNDADLERGRLLDQLTDPRKVHLLLSDLQGWQLSLTTAAAHSQQARHLSDSDPTLLSPEVLTRLGQLESDLAADQKDVAFARDLDGIRLRTFEPSGEQAAIAGNNRLHLDARAAEYAALFRSQGWVVDADQRESLIAALRQSAVRQIAATALEDWAQRALQRQPRDEPLVRRLLDVARGIDPDPWRDRFRQWEVWSNAARLVQMTREARLENQPPQMLGVVAALHYHHRQDPTPLLRTALLHYPGDFWLSYELGYRSDEAGKYDDAVAAYRAALALRPKSYQTLNSLGVVMGKKGDLTAAAEMFAKALEYFPTFAKAHSNLGKALFERGQYPAAIAHYRAALEQDADDPVIINNLGAALVMSGDRDAAMAQFERALKLDPGHAEAHNNRGIALREKGRYGEAVQALKKAHELQPRETRARMIAEYEAIARLSAVEPQTPLDLRDLEQGYAGRLTADLPLDITPSTDKSYRASVAVPLQAGHRYQIDLSGPFDTYLRIEDSRYNALVFNDDLRPPEVVQSRLVFAPERDDVHRLVVTTPKAKVTGEYTLRLQEVVPAGPPMVFRGAIGPGEPADDKGRHFRWHVVTLDADRPYTIVLESPDFDTRLLLADATRKKGYAQNEAMRPGRTRLSRLDLTPGQSTTYSVLASTARPNGAGNYTLTIQAYRPAAKE